MRRLFAVLLLLWLPVAAWAHVGSKDVFQTVHAGADTFYVTIRPPDVIPGIATVEIRSTGAAVDTLQITPLPVTGEASHHPPASDAMRRSAADPTFFTGAVWIMGSGAWQVRVEATGAAGPQMASVPVLAVPIATLKMQRGMGLGLGLLGLVLVAGMAGIVAASVRESRLQPGLAPNAKLQRRALVAAGVSLLVMLGAVALGDKWWNVEAADYAGNIYKPTPTTATLAGDVLDLRVAVPQGKGTRRDLPAQAAYLPDHGHLMHLYAIREPEMDAAYHLHPVLAGEDDFRVTLPAMQPGHYQLYGDVVHRSGFPETLLATVDIPAGMGGVPLDGEDAAAMPAPLSQGELGAVYKLPDGYTMTWDRPAQLTAGTAYTFRFHLLDPQGRPATAMQPYLGMAGHAAFVKTDGTVFAHTHPEGSAAMADVMLAEQSLPGADAMTMAQPESLTPDVGFPYGFPSAGRYRIFVQMKHAGTVETGVFDAEVK